MVNDTEHECVELVTMDCSEADWFDVPQPTKVVQWY